MYYKMDKNDILKALSTVQEPDLKKDLVSLKMIQDIEVNGNEVSFTIVLTTPACPLKEKIEKDCIDAIHHLVSDQAIVKITMTANVTSNRSDKLTLPNVKNIIAVASGKVAWGNQAFQAIWQLPWLKWVQKLAY